MDPERTPEEASGPCDDLDLWKKVEEERGQRSWDRYNRMRGAREIKASSRDVEVSRRPPATEPSIPKRERAEQPVLREEGSLDDLWQQAEAELQRRRAQAASSSRGLRVYDMAKGEGKGVERSSYPSRAVTSSWQGSLQQDLHDGRQYKVLLSRRNIDDKAVELWCRWARPKLARLPANAVVTMMDLGYNKVTAQGLQTLLTMLRELEVPVEALSLHHNQLSDEAADALAQFLQDSPHTLYELSLTNNQITEPGARTLLEAAVRAMQSPLELEAGATTTAVRYPALRDSQKVPLWLRLGYNRIGDGRPSFVRNFLRKTEAELLKIRQTLGSGEGDEDPWASFVGLRAGGTRAPDSTTHLFCEALSGLGCDQRHCSQLYPEFNGFPAGPVVHLFQIDQQLDRESCNSWQTPRPRRHDDGKGKGDKGGKGKSGKSAGKSGKGFRSSQGSDGVQRDDPRQSREKELRGLFDLPQEGERQMSPNSKRSRGTLAFVVRDVLEPESLGAEVSLWPLRSGDAVRVLYQGSEDLGDGGYLWASFNGREGWIPTTAVSGNWKESHSG